MAERAYKPKLDAWEMHIVIRALMCEANALMTTAEDIRKGDWREVEALRGRLYEMLHVDAVDMERITAKAEQSISEWQARAAEERAKLYEGAEPVPVGAE